jgi:four helix bundle protein
MIRSFRDLDVWRLGMDLVVQVYKVSEEFPRAEMYGLTSQVRRAAVSIPSNVAEGKSMGGKNYPKHIKIALGSEAELQTQIELAKRLKFLREAEADAVLAQAAQLGRMLVKLLNSLPRN